MTQQFIPPENKLEAVARMSNLTDSGPEDLGPGSKERKSVLLNLAKGLRFPVNGSLAKPKLGQEVAKHLGVNWDPSCFSTGSTITLEGLTRLLEGAEDWLLSRGRPIGLPKRALNTPKDEAFAILSVLAPQLSGLWDGRKCITEMREAEDPHWAQDKWAGFYFEYKARGELLKELGGGPRKFANTSFDYHLTSTWDLKAHSEGRAEAPLNDQVAMREAVEDGSGLGFVILSGERLDDDGTFREWQRQERLNFGKIPKGKGVTPDDEVADPASSTGTSTVQFRPTRIEIFHIPDVLAFDQALEQGVLKNFPQGHQASGAPRPPKYKLMLEKARQSLLLDTVMIGGAGSRPTRASRSVEGAQPNVARGNVEEAERDGTGENVIEWQYGPEWLSKLWGVPICPVFDTRTGKTV